MGIDKNDQSASRKKGEKGIEAAVQLLLLQQQLQQ
jgi:hypothetical protein